MTKEKTHLAIELCPKGGMSGACNFATETGQIMVDRSLFIEAMRHVAQSVTVVTTLGDDGPTGATVSAFSSLSADPPSVLVCLRSDSRIGLAVGRNRVFCVNVLPEGASALAGRFAGRFDAEEPDRFGAIDCRDSASGPVIRGATAFECTVDHIITHGSHDICIGNVTAITNAATPPLTYMDGSFQVVRPEGAY